jgi:hypothetical protein
MSNSDYATMLTFLHSAICNAYDIADHLRQNGPTEGLEFASEVFCHLARAQELVDQVRP